MDDSEVTFNRHDNDNNDNEVPHEDQYHSASGDESDGSVISVGSHNGAGDGVINHDRLELRFENFQSEIKESLSNITSNITRSVQSTLSSLE